MLYMPSLYFDSYDDEKSDVELAMEAVRKASQNISAYKLDLRRVFDEFDLSGDGFIDSFEMRNVFERLGIKLNDYAADAIFKHFDGDSSGKVDYGEFVWAFFNRRTFLRKWKKQTDHLTDRDIEAYFRKADTTGDGQLNAWELQGMLKNLGIVLPRHEVQMLIGKFDLDGDGLLDVFEFHKYMKAEEELGRCCMTNVAFRHICAHVQIHIHQSHVLICEEYRGTCILLWYRKSGVFIRYQAYMNEDVLSRIPL
jgi:Ca2+-binding EF-hand superfamily protein